MIIPKKINGYYENIKLVELSPEEIKYKYGEDEDINGYYDKDKKTIYYVNDENVKNTIFHELGHYFFMNFCITDDEFAAEAFANFLESITNQLNLY